jgi:hypothetical protein
MTVATVRISPPVHLVRTSIMIITLLAVVVWVPVACNILLHLTGHEHARQRSERLETTSIYLKLGKLEPP